jgi:hypothetical protein
MEIPHAKLLTFCGFIGVSGAMYLGFPWHIWEPMGMVSDA